MANRNIKPVERYDPSKCSVCGSRMNLIDKGPPSIWYCPKCAFKRAGTA